MRYDKIMTDNPKINVPVFLIPVSREKMLAMQSLLVRVQESVSVIERETGKLLTTGNRNRDNALVSLGHDVFALLFSFPANQRSLTAFFNEAVKQDPYETRSGDIANIHAFFSRLDYETRVPTAKTRRGKVYPARWDARENIPCLIHRARNTTEEAFVSNAGFDALEAASRELNTICKEALEIWSPYIDAVRTKNKDWRENTDEGKAYDEAFRKRIDGILAR